MTEKIFRLLITGSRDWSDYNIIAKKMAIAFSDARNAGYTKIIVVHGGAKGADSLAREFSNKVEERIDGLDIRQEIHYPEWDKHKSAAGPIRNKKMVDKGANLCLAFIKNKSRGATGCAAAAKLSGIKVEYERI